MMVPAISSSTVGPLGIAHLPRLWLKILAHANGELPDGYRHGNGGFDEALCAVLGLDRDEFVGYVEHEKPAYLALEAWIVGHARDLSPRTVAAWNRRVFAADLPNEMALERRASLGLAEERMTSAVLLNDLDDWAALHATLTSARASATAQTEGSR